jgi:hypothetical protein
MPLRAPLLSSATARHGSFHQRAASHVLPRKRTLIFSRDQQVFRAAEARILQIPREQGNRTVRGLRSGQPVYRLTPATPLCYRCEVAVDRPS